MASRFVSHRFRLRLLLFSLNDATRGRQTPASVFKRGKKTEGSGGMLLPHLSCYPWPVSLEAISEFPVKRKPLRCRTGFMTRWVLAGVLLLNPLKNLINERTQITALICVEILLGFQMRKFKHSQSVIFKCGIICRLNCDSKPNEWCSLSKYMYGLIIHKINVWSLTLTALW